MNLTIQIIQFLLSLAILVLLHEGGHFLFAKLFKTRVEKFYMFFNPWFSLFKKKIGETEYGIGWLPLGGYVKISGMIDESMDKEQMKKPPQPWEFRSKPAWQRFFIMFGGVLVNFILAVLIYSMLMYAYGTTYLPTQNAKYGIWCNDFGKKMGLRNGDKIISVDDKPVEVFSEVMLNLLLGDQRKLTVNRNGEKKNIYLTDGNIADLRNMRSPIFTARIPFVAGDFSDNSNAHNAGLQKGDTLVGFNGYSMRFFDQYKDSITANKNKTVNITVKRQTDSLTYAVKIDSNGFIGIAPISDYAAFFELDSVKYSFFAAFPAGINKGFKEINNYLKQFKLIFNPKTEAYKSVGSFITFVKIYPDTWDWYVFWRITAYLSIILAVLNILPIPGLDGGHIFFLLIEVIIRRKPSDKVMEYAQIAGMFILISLMIWALRNDFINHIF